MPYVGQNLPDKWLRKLRLALQDEVERAPLFKRLWPNAKFKITRKPYTGDYTFKVCTDNLWLEVAKMGILPMPGCRKILIFHHVETFLPFRHQGIGKVLLGCRIAAAKAIGTRLILCTVLRSNRIENDILIGNEFYFLSSYHDGDRLEKCVILRRRELP